MEKVKPLLRELEDAVSKGDPERRLRAIWHATDVLVDGTFTEEQIKIFGEVLVCLSADIEHAARVRLSNLLAKRDNAPLNVVRQLAFDDSIEVAGPVLRYSERIDPRDLVANASSKGQQHMLAISQRKTLPVEVTDVLVVRGSPAVARSVVSNRGAKLSDTGFLHLVRRSDGDRVLAEQVGLRRDIPQRVFEQLVAKASDDVRRKLETERPDLMAAVRTAVNAATSGLHAKHGPASKDYFAAKAAVGGLHREGQLNEDKVFEFAYSMKFNEAAFSTALLCDLPAGAVERALTDRNRSPVLIMAKALGFGWNTAMALLFLGAPDCRIPAGELEAFKAEFQRLTVENASRVLEVYRASTKSRGAGHRLAG